MKVTAKLAKHGFDIRYFFETIDFHGHGHLKFIQFLAVIKERFSLYLSAIEIESLYLFFNPNIISTLEIKDIETCVI